jgi:hypothetical protein
MKKTIKKILKTYISENRDRKDIINQLIEKNGLYLATKMVGGYDSLKKLIGGYNSISREYFIDTIDDLVSDFDDAIGVVDINMNPIITRDEDGELCQVEMLYPTGVGIGCYGGYKYEQELDFIVMNYYDLDNDIIYEIFEGLMDFDQ